MKKNSMGRIIAASSVESADIFYGSGFNAPDEFMYVETPSRKVAIVSVLEYSRAREEAHKSIEVIDRADIMKCLGDDEEKCIFKALSRFFEVDNWQVPARFPFAYAEKMRKNNIGVSLCDGEFFPERAVKNESEIVHIQNAMRVTEEAMRMAHDFIAEASVAKSGELLRPDGEILTSEHIRSTIETFFKSRGYSAERTIVASGVDGASPHNIGHGPIMKSTPVVVDIFPRDDVSGYWGDMTRTFCKGKAPAIVKRAYEAVKKAASASESHVRAGVPAILIHQIAAKTLEESAFATGRDGNGNPCGFIHGLGHGVGLEIHEHPRVSPSNHKALEAGNVISNEPGLYYGEWGGIRLEDLLLVTQDGCRNFCTMEKELEID